MPGIADTNLSFSSSKRKVYYTFEDGPVYHVYPVHFFLFGFVFLFLMSQLSSISLLTNPLRSLSRFKSKSKSDRHLELSSNAFSHSFPQNRTHHYECLPQGRESLYVHLQQSASSRPPSHLKIVNHLKLKHLESRSCSLNPKHRPTDRPTETNILSKYSAVYPPSY